MKYALNKTEIDLALKQSTISDAAIDFNHHDLVNEKATWFAKGYTPILMSSAFLKNIQTNTAKYIEQCANEVLGIDLKSLTAYHKQVLSDEEHLRVIKRTGKLLPPAQLGIDVNALAQKVKQLCKIDYELGCRNVCDIRIFRPWRGRAMDNNPLHRDTWLPILNNCINVYIPVAGNTRLSSLSLIPGSHLWKREEVERTETNALINGVQYGLPSVTGIKRKFKVIRPMLHQNEVLLFSSNMIHGGAVNLNKDITRVSIEIRFWPKALLDKEEKTAKL